MQIEHFSMDLESPLVTANTTIKAREGFLIRIELDGSTGVGEATPLPGWTESFETCRTSLERAAAIAEERDWSVALARMDAPAARHGLSLALADARGHISNEPLYRILGADRAVRTVPVNGTIGDGAPSRVGAIAEKLTDTGMSCLKVKVGVGDLDRDRQRLDAIRAAIEDQIELRLDANGAWDRETAAEAIDIAADYGISYIEQPLPPDDLEGLAALRGQGVEIAVDETLVKHDFGVVHSADAADVVICKPMVLGGPDRAVAVAAEAADAGINPVVSTTVDMAVARTAAVHVAATIPEVQPCGLATADRLKADLCHDPAPIDGGAMSVPQSKGLGIREVSHP